MDCQSKDCAEVYVLDAAERKVTVGCIVQTLRVDYLRRSLSSTKEESVIQKIANKKAIIHDIVNSGKVYLEVLGENVVGTIPANCIALDSSQKSAKVTLGDGSSVGIGSLVKIPMEEVHGWLHGMIETCGKTGKIVRITNIGTRDQGNILVQFAWGPRYYYAAKDLSLGYPGDIMTQEMTAPHNWIHVGSIVQVTQPPDNLKSQQSNSMKISHDLTLTGEYVTVKRIFLKAFSSSKMLEVMKEENGDQKLFSVHLESLRLIDHVVDKEGNKIGVTGEKVRLEKNEEKVKEVLGDKGWDVKMVIYLGIPGITSGLRVGADGSLWVKVQFYDDKFFYFKPIVLTLHNQKDDKSLYSKTVKPWITTVDDSSSRGITLSTTLEMIEYEDLNYGEELGTGSYGSVYRGLWRKNDKWNPVAIKKIGLSVQVNANAVWMEANTQLSMRHPNIVRLYGIHEEPKELWVVMDLVNGQDLFSLLFDNPNPETKLNFEQKRKLCLDMCHAISYIHQRQYTHCDIKPHNMMIERKSEDSIKLLICDFGITRFLGEVNMNAMLTKFTKTLVGTPAYISPECYQQDEKTEKFPTPSYASDVWALGIVFFEMFTEQIFCDGGMKFLSFIMSNEDQLVKKRILQVPEVIRPIIAKTLDFEPRLRPTAQQLCEFFYEFQS